MRLLFSATPAFGHLVPLVPFARAALRMGHAVGVLTGGRMRAVIETELPGADFVEAGVGGEVFGAKAIQEDGVDITNMTPESEGAVFGRWRVKLGLEDSLRAARAWRPDAIVAESYDAIGPIVAATLAVRWVEVGLGPGTPAANVAALRDAAKPFADDLQVSVQRPAAYIDSCPPAMKPVDWSTDVPIIRMRAEPFASAASTELSFDLTPGKPTVLVTFGTLYANPAVVMHAIDAVRSAGAQVIATEGSTFAARSGPAQRPTAQDGVHWVQFEPLASLLPFVQLVVGAGGSGTVFAAAATGRPMVLFPQGADQPLVSAAAARSGAALVVNSAELLPVAITAALDDPALTAAALVLRDEVANMPSAEATVDAAVGALTA